MARSFDQFYTTSSDRLLSTIIYCVVILLLAGCEADKTDIEYLDSAKQYALKGDNKAYEIELKNALQQNPENAEARYLLGQKYLSDQFGASADKEFERAVKFGYPPEKVALERVKAKYYQFEYQEIIDFPFAKNAIDKSDLAEIYFYHGLAQIGLGQGKTAEDPLQKAADIDPSSQAGQLAKAYLLTIFRNFHEAKAIVEELISKDDNFTEAYILLNRINLILNLPSEAAEAISKATQLEPNRLNLLVVASRTYIANKQTKEAEVEIDKVLRQAPQHLYSNLIKARLRLQAKDWEEARRHAETALNQSQVNKEAKLISGIANFYLESWENARNRLLSVKDFIKPDHMAHRMISYTEFKLGTIETADSILESIGTLKSGDEKLLSSLGSELAKQGKLEEAVSLFETAAGLNPNNSDILTRLGILQLESNNASGLSTLEGVLEKDASSFWARAAIARNHLQKGQTQAAINVVKQLAEQNPENIDSHLLLADIYMATKQMDLAEKSLQSALALDGKNLNTFRKYFKLSVASDNFDQAELYNNKILEANPLDRSALLNMYRLGKRNGEAEKAITKIQKVVEDQPADDQYKLLAALVNYDNGNELAGTNILKNITSVSDQYVKAQAALGRVHFRNQKFEEAIPYFKTWVDLAFEDPQSHQALASAYIKSERVQDALEALKTGLKEFPNNKVMQLSEVELLLQFYREEQAIVRAAKLREKQKDNPDLDLIFGRYYASKKEYGKALEFFRSLHALSPSSLSVVGIAQMQNLLTQRQDAISSLTSWLKKHPQDQPVRLFLANLNLGSDQKAAVKQFRQLVKANNSNFVALNNLAWALGLQGKLIEALSFAEKAYKLRPDSPAILDTYGYLLLQSGDSKQAEKVLSKAYEAAKSNPSIAYHYAMALDQIGSKEKAASILENLIRVEFAEKKDAIRLYNKLK